MSDTQQLTFEQAMARVSGLAGHDVEVMTPHVTLRGAVKLWEEPETTPELQAFTDEYVGEQSVAFWVGGAELAFWASEFVNAETLEEDDDGVAIQTREGEVVVRKWREPWS